MSTYNSYEDNTQVVYGLADKQTRGAFLTKVFGLMFILLLICTSVAAGFGYGFQFLLLQAANAENIELINQLTFAFYGTIIVSAIALLVMSFVLPIKFIRGRSNILVPLVIYVILMGLMLSAFTVLFDWVILVEAFGVTTIIFGVMALLGYMSKGRLAGIGFILLGLAIGAIVLSLANFVLITVGGVRQENIMLSWIVSLLTFAFLMFVTLYDVNRIKRIAEKASATSNNLIYYCAFILFSDFIALLVRVIYYLAIFSCFF